MGSVASRAYLFVGWLWFQMIHKNLKHSIILSATLLVIFIFSIAGHSGSLEELGLKDTELQWLKHHRIIKVGVDPDFPPIEYFDEDGKYYGISADFIALIAKKLNIEFEIAHLKNWSQVIEKGKSREIDMFAAAVPTPERLKYMSFTKPYVEFPAVVLVQNSAEDFPNFSELQGKRVAVVANYADHEYMKKAYPNIPLEVMPDISSGLRQVSFGKVDAMVLNIASASYYIQKEGITNLMVTEDTNFVFDLSFAARNDSPLASILDKAMAAVSKEEKKKILDKWISLGKGGWHPTPITVISFLSVLLVVVLFGILNWNRLLQRQVKERTADLETELSERIRAEKEKVKLQQQIHRAKKMEALGLLAGGVAHDLNNILSGVVGYSDLVLQRIAEDNPEKKLIRAIQDSGKRAAAVVADLLTISRDAAAERKIVNLNELVRQYLRAPEHQSLVERFPAVEFMELLDEQIPNISCSEVHIKKCIMNLVINAAEAVKEGRVLITTELKNIFEPNSGDNSCKPGKYVLLSVHDTGPGISPEDLERIFEPFYTKKMMGRHSGTGLGLAVVWNTIIEHGGFIRVEQPGRGSCFQLFFPASEQKIEYQEQDLGKINITGNGESVLVIDDEEYIRQLAKDLLTSLNYKVYLASSGEQALAFLKLNKMDLVILDMLMEPGLNGLETYEKILEFLPEQKALITSGFSENQDVKRAQKLGAGPYVKKPYTIDALGLAVKKTLSNQFSTSMYHT